MTEKQAKINASKENMEAQVVEFQEREIVWKTDLETAKNRIKELEEKLKKKK